MKQDASEALVTPALLDAISTRSGNGEGVRQILASLGLPVEPVMKVLKDKHIQRLDRAKKEHAKKMKDKAKAK